ncbi:hypothetical protein [Pseudophaeobacter flagellatus]|uniref:hypothetical protein n=1 Tax=Pseudophaeobacter flagellatus TaxID=2899119 RepID=UPI001E4ADA37|nr:hypothetical protein [Pseudophaeobacter flagellatus]
MALMGELGPTLHHAPYDVFQWRCVVTLANPGSQRLCFCWLLWRWVRQNAVSTAVGAGNRNFALFLIALPAATTDPLPIFLGCYQVPMYLTTVVMRRTSAKAWATGR